MVFGKLSPQETVDESQLHSGLRNLLIDGGGETPPSDDLMKRQVPWADGPPVGLWSAVVLSRRSRWRARPDRARPGIA